MLFQFLLKSLIHEGRVKLITAKGKIFTYGDDAPPHVTIRLHKKSLEWSLGLNPELKIGEAYMEGTLTIEEGTLREFLHLLLVNYRKTGESPLFQWFPRLVRTTRHIKQFNPPRRARANVAYHYDMPDDLYTYFLDPDRQYSCAYFTDPTMSLAQAQLDKKRHLASKLFLNRAGLKVLDIGSGWGGLGLYLAREASCRVTGVTLSTHQFKISRERARKEGLSTSCHFELRDYRQEEGPYDRIVSVGMFEHVGKKNYEEFFSHIHRLLADDGVCLLHAIGRSAEAGPVNGFIRKHIFPGVDVATLSEVLPSIERIKLYVTDIEILRLHYAETLRHWAERLQAHRAEIIARYGEVLYRKWEYYFIGCEMGFRHEYLMVFQIQLAKKLATVPLTRDYIHEWEQSHKWVLPITAPEEVGDEEKRLARGGRHGT